MAPTAGPTMLAIVGGTLALLLGLLLLLLPLVATELSRPRDSVWGAVVLLLGLVLVTSADRLTGAPMLAVLCGGLLIGRLGSEVGLGRWRQLTDDERQLLASSERWSRSVQQLGAASTSLLERSGGLLSGLATKLASRPPRTASSKRWVRPEQAAATDQTDQTDQPDQTEQTEQVQPTEPEPQPPADSASSGLEPEAGTKPAPATDHATEPATVHREVEGAQATPAAAAPASPPAAAAPAAPGASNTELGSSETSSPSPAVLGAGFSGPSTAQQAAPRADTTERTRVVCGFEEITALLAAAPLPGAKPSEAG